MPDRVVAIALALAAAWLAGCDSHADSVCENVGACSQAGDSDWIERCQSEAKSLEREAANARCSPSFDAYYRCADDHYTCRGASAAFPGCDAARAALTKCLARTEKASACRTLEARRAACAVATDDGGAEPDSGANPLAGCDPTRECQARCFLDQVADACVPTIAELDAFSSCAQSCPP